MRSNPRRSDGAIDGRRPRFACTERYLSNSTSAPMRSTTASTPSPVWQLVSSTGRPPRTSLRFAHHARQIDFHVRREVDLVDHQQVALQRHRARACAECRRRRRRRSRTASSRPGRARTWTRDCRRRFRSGSARASGKHASSSSAACMLSVGSSRMAVCGHAPVSTASTRSRIDQAAALHALGVLLGDQIVGDHREVGAAAMKRGISCSSSAVLPEPTGPPMPTRAAGCSFACEATAWE